MLADKMRMSSGEKDLKFIKLPDLTNQGSSIPTAIKFTDDSVYLAVYLNGEINIYKKGTGDTYNFLTSLACFGEGLAWSADGVYLVAGNGNRVTLFKRTGDSFAAVYTYTSDLAGTVKSVSITPDGTCVAAVHSYSPYIAIWERVGDTLSRRGAPADLPGGNSNVITFSPNGLYMIVGYAQAAPYVIVYKRDGFTFTKLNTLAGSYPICYSVRYSDDGLYLALGSSSGIAIFKQSGDNFIKLANPDVTPIIAYDNLSFASKADYLSAGLFNVAPYFIVYKRAGDAFKKIADPEIMPSDNVRTTAFSRNGKYFAVGHGGDFPRLLLYKLV